jgi:hypothetical protein
MSEIDVSPLDVWFGAMRGLVEWLDIAQPSQLKPHFEDYVVHGPAGRDAGPGSPIAYVRSILGHDVAALIMDGRRILGLFVALDANGQLVFVKATENIGGRSRKLERVVIPLNYVVSLEDGGLSSQ